MGTFSETELPPNDFGYAEVPYPAIVQANEDHWVLLQPFSYTKDDGTIITAPAGMTTDLASIPRFAWDLLPPFGKYTGAAVIHDFLYQTQPCTREVADLTLAEAMDAEGVDHKIRETIYSAVRLFGQEAWDKHSKGKPS